MNYKSYGDLSEDIKNNIGHVRAQDFDLIVGIPRSGMIPAYIIGLTLNVDITDINNFVNNGPLFKGITRETRKKLEYAHEAKKVLLVDDSILTGESLRQKMNAMPAELKAKISTLAIYSDVKQRTDVDYIFACVPFPRVFEWNIFHRDLLGRACIDLDGLLSMTTTNTQQDNGEHPFNPQPQIIPSYKIHSLVSNRPESYRTDTVAWLARHGIEYDNLVMFDQTTANDRPTPKAQATRKAAYYRSDKSLELFIERDLRQARRIVRLTGKPVYCVEKNEMLSPTLKKMFSVSPRLYGPLLKREIGKLLPEVVKNVFRPLYGFIKD